MGARTRVIHTRDICEREGDGERLGTRDTAGDGGGRWTGGDGGIRRENTVFPYRTGDTLNRSRGTGERAYGDAMIPGVISADYCLCIARSLCIPARCV